MIVPAVDAPLTEATPIDRRRSWSGTERRKGTRVPLHWTVYLACKGAGHPFRAITRDISRDGFYCLIDQPLRAGERIECDIVVPTHRSRDPDDVVYLRCQAQAVRVEKNGADSNYGVACRIENYRVIRGVVQGRACEP